ncbi:hypothetical protein IC582_009561 [Cucumis melo]|uniref:Uncharacterized protein LOC103486348 isoform X1 n=1 Tax=Cucumis melo TaxID=3656 RepID=A0A1S3B5T5_CUCME|nr:uncharacterized protein LOC103486348 isoform X1 [Cucumis melo]XP_050940190.1 uncharacterized protein LOC103486348 isoform X1 [Cucumis melo]
MSEKKASDGSSFSFTSDLFGIRDTSSLSSNHIFGPVFSSSSSFKASQNSEVGGKSHAVSYSPKTEGSSKYKECKNGSTSSREVGSFYQEQRTNPCHLSSSIYYGGQDIYTDQNPGTGFNSSLKRDGGEDDSGGASRGNWWQGSLYY